MQYVISIQDNWYVKVNYHLEWTTEPPTTEEGFYWTVEDGCAKIVEVKVFIGRLVVADDMEMNAESISDGTYSHWLGPLPVPKLPKG